jgi:hypothetical protein
LLESEANPMRGHSIVRSRRIALTAALLWSLAAPAAAQSEGMFFDGGGFGPTEDIAVQRAIEDAEVSASAYQLFTCELVGEPQIFPGTHPERGPVIRAQVRVFCTP